MSWLRCRAQSLCFALLVSAALLHQDYTSTFCRPGVWRSTASRGSRSLRSGPALQLQAGRRQQQSSSAEGAEAEPEALGDLLRSFEEARQWQRALALLPSLAAAGLEEVQTAAYGFAAASLVKVGHWQTAALLLDQAFDPESNVFPDVVMYTAAVDVAIAAGVVGGVQPGARAWTLFSELKAHRLKPSTEFFNALIAALSPEDSNKALLQLTSMKAMAASPDETTFRLLLGVCSSIGLWEKSLVLLTQLKERGFVATEESYSHAISSCRVGRQWLAAVALLSDMKGAGLVANVTMYNAALAASAAKAEWELAIRLLELLRQKGIATLESYNYAIGASGRARQFEPALWVLKTLQADGLAPSEESYRFAISACQDHWPLALHLLQETVSKDLAPLQGVFDKTLLACKTAADCPEVIEALLQEMTRRGLSIVNAGVAGAAGKISGTTQVTAKQLIGATALYRQAIKDGTWSPWVQTQSSRSRWSVSTPPSRMFRGCLQMMSSFKAASASSRAAACTPTTTRLSSVRSSRIS